MIETNDWRLSTKMRASLTDGVFAMTRADMLKVQEANLARTRYDLAILEGIGGTVPSNTSKFRHIFLLLTRGSHRMVF